MSAPAGSLAQLGLREADDPDVIRVANDIAGRIGCQLVDLDDDTPLLDPEPAGETVAVQNSVVRPFVRARGRVTVMDHLELETLVSAIDGSPLQDLPTGVDDGRIIALCRSPRSVAEVVALLGFPLTLVMIMITDAVRRGLLKVHSTRSPSADGRPPMDVLVRLREGLRRMV